jgi:hypothetical protein
MREEIQARVKELKKKPKRVKLSKPRHQIFERSTND